MEQNLPKLTGRAVAYLNSDMCVFGPDLVASASDPLKALIIEAMKSVPDPVDPTQSYFEYWSNAGGTGNGGYTGRVRGFCFLPVSLSNYVDFTPRLLYSSTHRSQESFTHLKTV